MQTYGDYTIYLCYWKKSTSAYFSINSHINYRSYSFKAKISSSTSSNFGYCALKFAGRNPDAYQLIVEVNLLVLLLKALAKRKTLLLAIQNYTCIIKTG